MSSVGAFDVGAIPFLSAFRGDSSLSALRPEAVAKMVENSMSLLVVLSTSENTPIGIVTLHDVIRLQNQLSDAAAL
jgi:CBS domain-containing protein